MMVKKTRPNPSRQDQRRYRGTGKPDLVSNVQLVCASCGKPSRVGHEMQGDRKVRVCKKCGDARWINSFRSFESSKAETRNLKTETSRTR